MKRRLKKLVSVITYLVGTAKWALRQRRLAKAKFPWLVR